MGIGGYHSSRATLMHHVNCLKLFMPPPQIIVQAFVRLTDAVFDRRFQPQPWAGQLERCKIISHRGAHDNIHILENSMEAFNLAATAGVWGIEFDLRWTKDLEPVVFHDRDLRRLHGNYGKIEEFSLKALRKNFPAVPTLSEVVNRFGRNVHLMIEVKRQPWMDPSRQISRLQDILSVLEPCTDYHLITTHPEAMVSFEGLPPATRVAIAMTLPGRLSRRVLQNRWGGICGHYVLVSNRMVQSHHRHGQKVGTGYIQSRNCLFREINRGVDWIFSNHAVRLQGILNQSLKALSSAV